MIYHAVLMSNEIEGVFPDDPYEVEEGTVFPDVEAVCGRTIPAYRMILLEGWNSYIPVVDVPEGVERGKPVVCINCATELFDRIRYEDLYRAENPGRWSGTEEDYE